MARRLRIHAPGAIYHVMLRGNDKQKIFFSEEDKHKMAFLLDEGTKNFDHSILAFCFMDNHVHFAIQVRDDSISTVIQNLAFRYTQYVNRKYKKVGHLFQGRFKSIIVLGNKYLKELIRYIHLNPVRANLVTFPDKYLWSSHRAYLDLAEFPWVSRESILSFFRNESDSADTLVNYNGFILQGIGIDAEVNFDIGYPDGVLGDEKLIENFFKNLDKLNQKKIKLPELIDKFCTRFNLLKEELCSSGKNTLASEIRGLLAFFIKEIEESSIQKLSIYFNRDPSGLSKQKKAIEQKIKQSSEFAKKMEELRVWIHS